MEFMDMAHIVRVYDTYTNLLKLGGKGAADNFVEESDDAELKQKKISLQTAFQNLIQESLIFSIMITERMITELPCLLHYVKEHAEIVRASARYAVALGEAREIAKKYCLPPNDQSESPPTTQLDPSATTLAEAS